MKSDRFRAAAESKDFSAIDDLFTEDVVFRSPVVFTPYEGREAIALLLGAVAQVFQDFRYTDQLEAPGGLHALIFRAGIDGREIEGLDLLRLDEEGLIADFTVMLRPISGLLPFAQAMGEKVQAAGLATTRA